MDHLSPRDRLALLAHEVASPVAALVAVAQALSEGETLAAGDRRRLLELALEAGRSVERLLADPELFSVHPERVDVAALLSPVPAGVTVTAEPGLTVLGDPVRLRQALGNLVANGLRHGGSVTVSATEAETEVRLAVSDDGPGVTPEADLFELGTSHAGSTGYGLYVVREVAEAHGGRVELVSSPGRGATFTLVLPSSRERG